MQNELDTYRADLESRGIELVVPEITHQQLNEDELLEIMPSIDGVIAGDDHFTAAVLEASRRLRILSKWGVGTDAIDKDAAARLGIPVTNTPGMFGADVAEVALSYMLMLARGMHIVDRAVHAGTWLKLEGETLAGKTVGVVGLGSLGLGVCQRVKAFDMVVIGSDPWPPSQDNARALGVEVVDLDELFRRCDYLSLNAPLTPESRHLVNAKTLALMKPGAKVVNTGRGPLVDEAALIDALRSGHIAAAALDVFEVEPLPADSPLRTMDNVILGAHNGSNTREAVQRTSAKAVDNLLAHLFTDSPRP
jgi:D-3-phosphoglycerate dehydrogenase